MKRVAILGATGYIGRSLVEEFLKKKSSYTVTLLSRSKEKVQKQLQKTAHSDAVHILTYEELAEGNFDIVINCTGVGDPKIAAKDTSNVFSVTESMDALVLSYLKKHPTAQYINLSSGAVYGDVFTSPADESKRMSTSTSFFDSYSIAKCNAEAKHRALLQYRIVDLRVFAFFSEFVDVKAGFLMSEIAGCLKKKKVFETNDVDIARDFVTPPDLFLLIESVINKKTINGYFDVYSKRPIKKLALLAELEKSYGLQYSVKKIEHTKAHLAKAKYYSTSNKATVELGYQPAYTSLLGIENELSKMGIKKIL